MALIPRVKEMCEELGIPFYVLEKPNAADTEAQVKALIEPRRRYRAARREIKRLREQIEVLSVEADGEGSEELYEDLAEQRIELKLAQDALAAQEQASREAMADLKQRVWQQSDPGLGPDGELLPDAIERRAATGYYHTRIGIMEDYAAKDMIVRICDKGSCTANHKLSAIRAALGDLMVAKFGMTSRQWGPALRRGEVGRHRVILGIAADEDQRAVDHGRPSYERPTYPLVEMNIPKTAEQPILERAGFGDVKKSGCFMCKMQGPGWYWLLAKRHPDLFAQVVEYERRAVAAHPREPTAMLISTAFSPKKVFKGRPIDEAVVLWRAMNPDVTDEQIEAKDYQAGDTRGDNNVGAQLGMFKAAVAPLAKALAVLLGLSGSVSSADGLWPTFMEASAQPALRGLLLPLRLAEQQTLFDVKPHVRVTRQGRAVPVKRHQRHGRAAQESGPPRSPTLFGTAEEHVERLPFRFGYKGAAETWLTGWRSDTVSDSSVRVWMFPGQKVPNYREARTASGYQVAALSSWHHLFDRAWEPPAEDRTRSYTATAALGSGDYEWLEVSGFDSRQEAEGAADQLLTILKHAAVEPGHASDKRPEDTFNVDFMEAIEPAHALAAQLAERNAARLEARYQDEEGSRKLAVDAHVGMIREQAKRSRAVAWVPPQLPEVWREGLTAAQDAERRKLTREARRHLAAIERDNALGTVGDAERVLQKLTGLGDRTSLALADGLRGSLRTIAEHKRADGQLRANPYLERWTRSADQLQASADRAVNRYEGWVQADLIGDNAHAFSRIRGLVQRDLAAMPWLGIAAPTIARLQVVNDALDALEAAGQPA